MSLKRVKKYFEKEAPHKNILEFEVSSATVELAAKALGCEEARIAKTLSFLVNENPLLVVTAGDSKIDNVKFKTVFHTKAKMLKFDEVEPLIGHEVGGVCPFGLNNGVKVFLDTSLKRFETVFPACGSSNSAVEMTIEELERYSKSLGWVDVCKQN